MNLKAQVDVKSCSFTSSLKNHLSALRDAKAPFVIFFCPLNSTKDYSMDSARYELKLNALHKNLEYKQIDTLTTFAIYTNYKKTAVTNGAYLFNNAIGDSIFVDFSQMKCFLINFDSHYIKRSMKKFKSTFKVDSLGDGVVRVDIVDGAVCFSDLPSRIPGYAEFISESIKPKFEVDELLNMILERQAATDEKVARLETLIKELQKK